MNARARGYYQVLVEYSVARSPCGSLRLMALLTFDFRYRASGTCAPKCLFLCLR